MPSACRAVIDVGTNSVKLLVAEVAGDEVRPMWEGSKQTRLGRGFYELRRLQPEPIAKTAKAVAKFVRVAQAHAAGSIRIIATSAARDAVNAGELIAAIEAAAGLPVEVISGEQEANWAFEGVTTDPALADTPLLLLDAGGGSTEFILGQGHRKDFRGSFPLGTVRLLERFPHSDPPRPEELAACRSWLRAFLVREVRPGLAPALTRRSGRDSHSGLPQLIGAGGTASILGRIEAELTTYDRDRIDSTRLTLDRLRWHVTRFWGLPLQERRLIVGMPPKRADVILTGVLIYESVMEEFGFPDLRISSRGLRFAAAMNGVGLEK